MEAPFYYAQFTHLFPLLFRDCFSVFIRMKSPDNKCPETWNVVSGARALSLFLSTKRSDPNHRKIWILEPKRRATAEDA